MAEFRFHGVFGEGSNSEVAAAGRARTAGQRMRGPRSLGHKQKSRNAASSPRIGAFRAPMLARNDIRLSIAQGNSQSVVRNSDAGK